MIPVTVNGQIALSLSLAISALPGLSAPNDAIRLQALGPPTNFSSASILNSDGDKYTFNVTNNYFYLSSYADCTGTIPRCKDSVDAEVTCFLLTNPTLAYYPIQMLNQRRTGKLTLPVGQSWVYYWLVITNDLFDAQGQFLLYLGTQFWGSGAGEGVQMWIYNWKDGYPNGTGNPNVAVSFFPNPPQTGDWISPGIPLPEAVYYIGARNSETVNAYFTNKVGFNSPPVQAANVNASCSRFGLLALILICSFFTAKRF